MSVLANGLHDDLGDALARIASVLAIPVLILALAILIVTALEVGRFAEEVWRRNSRRRAFGPLTGLVAQVLEDPASVVRVTGQAGSTYAATALEQIAVAISGGKPQAIEHALTNYELTVQRRLDRTRVIVRAGPAVGLMGTLIPLAPGMEALGRGDIESLAGDLRIAFAATVIGLLAGTLAFALTLTRTRMYTEDLAALERATEAVRAAAASAPPPPLPAAVAAALAAPAPVPQPATSAPAPVAGPAPAHPAPPPAVPPPSTGQPLEETR